MTDEQVTHYLKKAKYVANTYGYSELAEDFAQELFIEFITKPDRHATVDQLFVDYLRRINGRPGSARYNGRQFESSLDDPENKYIKDHLTSVSTEDGAGTHSKSDRLDRIDSSCFRRREALIYELYFRQELTAIVIGEILGVSESRICQSLKSIKKKIQDNVIFQEGNERLEWDESFLSFKIQWIQLA